MAKTSAPPSEDEAVRAGVASLVAGETPRDPNPLEPDEDDESERIVPEDEDDDAQESAPIGLVPLSQAASIAGMNSEVLGELQRTKRLLDAEPKVQIILPQMPADQMQLPDETVTIMGYKYHIMRGEMVSVPRPVAEVLVSSGTIAPPDRSFRKFVNKLPDRREFKPQLVA